MVISTPNDSPALRREFLGRLAGGAALLAAGTLAAACAAPPPAPVASTDDEPWLKAALREATSRCSDAPKANEGFGLIFAAGYLQTMAATYNLKPGEANAFIVFRHFATPLGLSDAILEEVPAWAGDASSIMDPATKKPSEYATSCGNRRRATLVMNTDASADKMVAMPGVVIGVCHFAITVLSGMAAKGAGQWRLTSR